MLLLAQIRLTSCLLGELRPDGRGVRRFRMTGDQLFVNTLQWQGMFGMAAHQLKIDIDAATIQPPAGLVPASIHLYRRVYSQVHVEFFESFRKGTILTMDFMIHDHLKRAPDKPAMAAILSLIGSHFGISQFGNKFGYGRFNLLDLTTVTYESIAESQPEVQSR